MSGGGGETEPDGSMQMPWFEYSPLADRYMRAVAGGGFILTGFDWMRWMGTPAAQELRDDLDEWRRPRSSSSPSC